jgi:hypothetical protein
MPAARLARPSSFKSNAKLTLSVANAPRCSLFRTNLATGLSLREYDIGGLEEINLGTGMRSSYCLDVPLSGGLLTKVKDAFRHISAIGEREKQTINPDA